MIEKLKKLKFISLREHEDLDKIEIIYVDGENVFTESKSIGFGYECKLEHLESLIKQQFQSFIRHDIGDNLIETNENDVEDLIIEKLKTLKEIRSERKNDKNIPFIMLSENINLNFKILKKENIIENEFMDDNEIIIGYKTNIDEPGLIIITNKEALSDEKNIRLGLFDIGFYPYKSYYMIKLK